MDHGMKQGSQMGKVLKNIEKEWIDKSGFLRLRPDHLYNEGGMDGFFAALLKKRS